MANKSMVTVAEFNGTSRDEMHELTKQAVIPELIKVFNKYIKEGVDPEDLLVSLKVSMSEILKEFEEHKLYINKVADRLGPKEKK